jgi:hypothetical protein
MKLLFLISSKSVPNIINLLLSYSAKLHNSFCLYKSINKMLIHLLVARIGVEPIALGYDPNMLPLHHLT